MVNMPVPVRRELMDSEAQELEESLTVLVKASRENEQLQPELISTFMERLTTARHPSRRFDQIMVIAAGAQAVLFLFGVLFLTMFNFHQWHDAFGAHTTFDWIPMLVYLLVSILYAWGFCTFWIVRRERR